MFTIEVFHYLMLYLAIALKFHWTDWNLVSNQSQRSIFVIEFQLPSKHFKKQKAVVGICSFSSFCQRNSKHFIYEPVFYIPSSGRTEPKAVDQQRSTSCSPRRAQLHPSQAQEGMGKAKSPLSPSSGPSIWDNGITYSLSHLNPNSAYAQFCCVEMARCHLGHRITESQNGWGWKGP